MIAFYTFAQLFSHPAPSSVVVNISAGGDDIGPTYVRLTWNPPPIQDWNGVIVNYSISEFQPFTC